MVVDATLPPCLLILKIPLLGAVTSPRPRVTESLDPRLRGANSHSRAAVNCPAQTGVHGLLKPRDPHQQQQKQDPETTEPDTFPFCRFSWTLEILSIEIMNTIGDKGQPGKVRHPRMVWLIFSNAKNLSLYTTHRTHADSRLPHTSLKKISGTVFSDLVLHYIMFHVILN